jgi:hypothetical protein
MNGTSKADGKYIFVATEKFCVGAGQIDEYGSYRSK